MTLRWTNPGVPNLIADMNGPAQFGRALRIASPRVADGVVEPMEPGHPAVQEGDVEDWLEPAAEAGLAQRACVSRSPVVH